MMDALGFRNPVGLATLVKRELVRTYKVINQVVWPPIITTILYVLVFGLASEAACRTCRGSRTRPSLFPD